MRFSKSFLPPVSSENIFKCNGLSLSLATLRQQFTIAIEGSDSPVILELVLPPFYRQLPCIYYLQNSHYNASAK